MTSTPSLATTTEGISPSRACTKCKAERPLTEFFRHKKAKDGHATYCKVCATAQIRAYEIANPVKRWSAVATCGARYRAKRAGIPFAITARYMRSLWTEFCPVLGLRLAYEGDGRVGPKDASPSVDRVIPELGYVPGNVVVISNRANVIKSFGTAEEHRLIADWMDEHNESAH